MATKLPLSPNFNWCWTCLNKQCAAAFMEMSAEVIEPGNSIRLVEEVDESHFFNGFPRKDLISSVNLSLILYNSCTAALVWFKWKESVRKSEMSVQFCVSPTVKPYSLSVKWNWLSDKWGFWSRNLLSKDFDLSRTAKDNLRSPRCICPDLLKLSRYLSSFSANEGFVCNLW